MTIQQWILIPGFMKAGSTSVFSWLERAFPSPDVRPKEPRYLASPSFSHEGMSRYALAATGGSATAIDGSVGYLDPGAVRQVADRLVSIGANMPRPKFIVMVRDPVARSISHVRHDIRRGRLGRPDPQAMADLVRPGQPYFELSRYATAIAPLLNVFDPQDFLMVDAAVEDTWKWEKICDFVGVDFSSRAFVADRRNETASTRAYTPVLAWLTDRDLSKRLERFVPRSARPIASRVLLRSPIDVASEHQLRPLIRSDVIAQLAEEYERFVQLTGECMQC